MEREPRPTSEPQPKEKTNPVDDWLKRTFGRTEKELKQDGNRDAGLHRETMEKEQVEISEEEK